MIQKNITEYLIRQAEGHRDKTAYADETVSLSYGELYEESCRIGTAISKYADRLSNMKACPVVVFMEKSPHTLACFFGSLLSGNFYVPVDENMPEERIRLILDNLSPSLIISDEKNMDKIGSVAGDIPIVTHKEASGCAADEGYLKKVEEVSIDTDPAYVIYTSGSTGTPKGVAVSHRSLIDYADHFSAAAGFRFDDVVASQAPFHFDASLIDIYCTLCTGCTMVIVPIRLFSLPVKLLEFLEEKQVTLIRWVPSALNIVATFKALKVIRPGYLREIIFGAESMPAKCFNYWRSYYPDAVFMQIYGPTEITGICTYYIVDRDFADDEVIPIGRAIANSSVFLLDDEDRLITPQQVGVKGEICIKGSCLALGYYNAPELTDKSFTQDPLNKNYPEKIYRSGDLASYNERGELVFSSRKDFQIKHMGHRIELGEIEAAACAVEGIKAAVCLFDDKKNKIIMAYVSDTDDTAGIIRTLQKRLPRYMIPNIMKQLESMPLTSGGKADRQRLKAMFIEG